MSTTEFTMHNPLLGDSIWPEPALSALGEQRGEPVRLYVDSMGTRSLYAHNPHITLTEEPGGHTLDCQAAWQWAIDHEDYFAAGYFAQTGANLRPDSRLEFKLHGTIVYPDNTVLICPFSASCSSHQGKPANKTMPVEWWTELAGKLGERLVGTGLRVCSLGAATEPKIPGTVSWRGQPLRLAAEIVLASRVLVTVETFAAVVAGGKTIGSTLICNSATPVTLHVSPEMARRSTKVVREKYPWEWNMDTIVDTVMDLATK